ncbi:MAG: lipopolysaccharide biosynthesis protein RfbH [Parcubacteria group bacterium]|nr:lipopolysaccharide biosynthesis protein RfbH [Parcubacteria group bacterium]
MDKKLADLIRLGYKRKLSYTKFVPGQVHIPASGKSFDHKELIAMTEAVLDGWWTEGRFASEFENKLAKLLGVKYCIMTNSGSSANLLSISALASHNLAEKRIKLGDEVITLAAAFPTTVNPLILKGLTPVFVDIDLATANVDVSQLEKIVSKKTKAIFLPHHLGNPFNVDAVKKFCRRYKLWLIEDCCDALGSRYKNRYVGTFGDLATFSFYAAHHITTGEGGAVVTNNPQLAKIIRSLRDWGREYWFKTGSDKRRDEGVGAVKLSQLPSDYDDKFIFSEVGYNLKTTDLQASLGLIQLSKLNKFAKIRESNFNYLNAKLSGFSNFFILPKAEARSAPSWFGFLITLKSDCPFSRKEIVDHLHQNNVGTRMLFTGNVTKQPYFITHQVKHRKGDLTNTDFILKNSFWVGVYQGIDKKKREYMAKVFENFLNRYI